MARIARKQAPTSSSSGSRPTVSIVVSTFNRSNVLSFAIRSILAQTYSDWETIVVGDCCTDDTRSVLEALADPRIRFVNLPENTGDQSGPNSVGMRLARGKLIAFLNHDDMWFPDHLETLVTRLVTTGADLIVSAALRVAEVQSSSAGALVGSITTIERADDAIVWPYENFLASGWLMTSRLARRVGDWKPATRVRFASSQEFAYRCWASGADIRFSPPRSFVVIPSNIAPEAYGTRRVAEHEILAPFVLRNDVKALSAITTRGPIESPVTIASAIAAPDRSLGATRHRIAHRGDQIFGRTLFVAMRLGFAPWEYRAAIGGVRKGGSNDILRKIRGLPGTRG